MTPKKCVLVVLDGLGDRAYPELDGKTPLEAAETPHLDRLAAQGSNGLYHASKMGEALPSEWAHLAMFGYGKRAFPGRGVLEALGSSIEVREDEVAVLAHLVSCTRKHDTLVLQDDKIAVEPDAATALCAALAPRRFQSIEVGFHQTGAVDGVVIISPTGGAQGDRTYLSPLITDSDPMRKGAELAAVMPLAPTAPPGRPRDEKSAARTAAALRRYLIWAHQALGGHPQNKTRRAAGKPPLNALVTQRAGRPRPVRPFAQRYNMKGVSIASGLVYRGLCRHLGIEIAKVKDRQDPQRDLKERLEKSKELLKDYDFIHVHTKAPDQAAHKKSPKLKRDVITALDRALEAAIPTLLQNPQVLLVITADHSTPSRGPLIHSGEPLPCLFVGPGVRRDDVNRFAETAAGGGALGILRGDELMWMILSYTDRVRMRGLAETPRPTPTWPAPYRPLVLQKEETKKTKEPKISKKGGP